MLDRVNAGQIVVYCLGINEMANPAVMAVNVAWP